jgi:crotonobetainyl-CoA:carnitine CoA-transferase CaiB-like acyl-CoA transferase
VRALGEADVPAGPVHSVSEALASMGANWTTSLDGIELAPSPILVDGVAAPPRLPAPRLGEHTGAVLTELGER